MKAYEVQILLPYRTLTLTEPVVMDAGIEPSTVTDIGFGLPVIAANDNCVAGIHVTRIPSSR
jgi:hypothetical protein